MADHVAVLRGMLFAAQGNDCWSMEAAALDAAIAALSHAAGQEGVYASTGIWQSRVFDEEADPPCWSDWWTVRNRIKDEMAAASSQPIPTEFRELFVRITPALSQPVAEAVAWLVESGSYRQPFLCKATAEAQVFELRKGGYEASITPLGNPYLASGLRGTGEVG